MYFTLCGYEGELLFSMIPEKEPFPELDELIDYLTSPEIIAERKKMEKVVMDIIWEHRFWKCINN